MADDQIPGLYQMAMGTGADPYGGRTMAQVVSGGVPYSQGTDFDAAGDQFGRLAAAWSNQPATDALVASAINQGGARYQPDFAKQVQSSGPEGGWFITPGTTAETQTPWGMAGPGQTVDWGPNPMPSRGEPSRGLYGMSTNNPRLLPKGYNQTGGMGPNSHYIMRAGHLIDSYYMDKPLTYVGTHGGGEAPWGIGGPGHGYPVSTGSPSSRGYFFPGQLEPWLEEGGTGTY
jgi:hypothetical protein